MNSLNLAARAGRWSADNRKQAFFGRPVVAALALVVGSAAGPKEISDSETASGEAATAQRILEQAGFEAPATESVLVQSRRALQAIAGVPRAHPDLRVEPFGLASVGHVPDETTMKLLGDSTWYLPHWPRWRPSLSPEGRRAVDREVPDRIPAGT